MGGFRKYAKQYYLGSVNTEFCSAKEARTQLIEEYNWSIVDFGIQEECKSPFIITIKTDNPGPSQDNQFTIPAYDGLNNYQVDWGDGLTDTNVSGSITHTYAVPGTYQVAIRGDFRRIYFRGPYYNNDVQKILSVDQWGEIVWYSFENAFTGCQNLNILATDTPDLSLVTNLGFAFMETDLSAPENQSLANWDTANIQRMNDLFSYSNFNQDITGWDVSNVTRMQGIFIRTPFNQNIGKWNIESLSTFGLGEAFVDSAITADTYDLILQGWANLENTPSNIQLYIEQTYCEGAAARQTLIDTYGWTINDDGEPDGCIYESSEAFITTWKTDNSGSSEDNQITIPIFNGETYNYTVYWGDGTSDTNITGDITHTYTDPGTYQVAINGLFPRVFFGYGTNNDREKILSVDQWGTTAWSSFDRAFSGCSNFNIQATDVPDLSLVTDMTNAFSQTDLSEVVVSMGNWDVSNVERMWGLFSESNFNADISDWDVSKVTEMSAMFYNTPFNQNMENGI